MYLQKLLTSLATAFVNKIGERSHWRPPMWKPRAQYISWKCFEVDEVRTIFDDSCIPLAMTKAFNGQQEVEDNTLTTLGGASAIALAKAQARGRATRQQPTCRASLIIGEGEGRASREFELIWWPDLFSQQERGKLTLRYYVGKVMFTNF